MLEKCLYTIGHSNYSLEMFLSLLRSHRITAVADIRSIPTSRYCPHFNKETLIGSLQENHIRYVFLGAKLGGLRKEKKYFTDGKIDWRKVEASPIFQEGCECLRQGVAADFRIALLCTEREPEECHRFYLVSHYLKNEFAIFHILANGSIVSQEELEKQVSLQSRFYTHEMGSDRVVNPFDTDKPDNLPGRKKLDKKKQTTKKRVRRYKTLQNKLFLPSQLKSVLEEEMKRKAEERIFSEPLGTARFLDFMFRKCFVSHLRDGDKYRRSKGGKPFFGDRWINIPAGELQHLIGRNYPRIVRELWRYGVIDRSYYNFDTGKPFGYRFTDSYKDSSFSCFYLPPKDFDQFDENIKQKRNRNRERFEKIIHEKTPEPEGYLLAYNNLDSLTLECDENEFREILEKLKPEVSDSSYIHKMNALLFKRHEIIEGRTVRFIPFYSVDKYGRFHYFLTNLPEELRPFVRMNGQKIVSYDITTSQCVFFAMTVREEMQSGVDFDGILMEIQEYYPKHMSRFINTHTESEMPNHMKKSMGILRRQKWCLEYEVEKLFGLLKHDFYAKMIEEIGWSQSRSDFKKAFFEFLYGPNIDWTSPIIVQFQTSFPHIYLVLWKLKQLGDSRKRLKELRNQLYAEEYQNVKRALSKEMEEPGRTKENLEKDVKNILAKEAMKQFKREGKDEGKYYGQLPRRMQQIESEFIFQKIAPQIGRPFLTVHDSIIVEKSNRRNIKSIKKLIEDEFAKQGVTAHVKEEEW